VDSLALVIAALIALGAAIGIVRSVAPRERIARLLRVAPRVSVAEAIALARAGRGPYVQVEGRVDSDSEFEDSDHRPLVVRQTRIQVQRDGRWADLELVREVVPFDIREGLDGIAIDTDRLGEGLIVVPRESVGVVGDLGERVPDEVPDDLPARLVIELVSSVEHAIALGVPTVDAADRPSLGPGRGRPLVLTTMERDEAMRRLASGPDGRRRLVAGLVTLAVVLLFLGLTMFVLPGDALAASPVPTAVTGADTRSSGQGPGFVGALGPAFLAVVGIALLAIGLTLLYVRLTGGPRPPTRRR
jgi:hypothetical protein